MNRVKVLRLAIVGVLTAVAIIGLDILASNEATQTAAWVAAPILCVIGTIGIVNLAHRPSTK